MTRQEAIEQLEVLKIALLVAWEDERNAEAIEIGINALKERDKNLRREKK